MANCIERNKSTDDKCWRVGKEKRAEDKCNKSTWGPSEKKEQQTHGGNDFSGLVPTVDC